MSPLSPFSPCHFCHPSHPCHLRLNFRNLNSNSELKMEIIVAVVITYFIVSMKKNLTRPYTLTSREGGFFVKKKTRRRPLNKLFSGCLVVWFIARCLVVSLASSSTSTAALAANPAPNPAPRPPEYLRMVEQSDAALRAGIFLIYDSFDLPLSSERPTCGPPLRYTPPRPRACKLSPILLY